VQLGAALTNDYVASLTDLAAIELYAAALWITVSAVP
jgi:hypothetical protein